MSRKNTPPSYTDPGGPSMVDTHSYKLSPFGPALQFGGGSRVISASSFWSLLALEDSPLGDLDNQSFEACACWVLEEGAGLFLDCCGFSASFLGSWGFLMGASAEGFVGDFEADDEVGWMSAVGGFLASGLLAEADDIFVFI